jgi:hypothetical protein
LRKAFVNSVKAIEARSDANAADRSSTVITLDRHPGQ